MMVIKSYVVHSASATPLIAMHAFTLRSYYPAFVRSYGDNAKLPGDVGAVKVIAIALPLP
jgi:hypothetical protein